MRKNDRGFSLVELIVAMAIMVTIGIALFGFIGSGSNNYKRTNENVKLQYEQQTVVNQIRDMILEASVGIYFDASSKTLAIYDTPVKEDTDADGVIDDEDFPVTRINFDTSTGKMYFGKSTFEDKGDVDFSTISDLKLMAENVDKFEADLTKVDDGKVTFQIGFKIGETTTEVTEVVALRNRIVDSNDVDTVFGGTDGTISSFIDRITISRGDVEFPAAGTDEIGKISNEAVTVIYTANVETTQDSTREYVVNWRIEGDNLDGITMSNGSVTIEPGVEDGRVFSLIAFSIDEPDKKANLTITVKDGGAYPTTASLVVERVCDHSTTTSHNQYNGYCVYKVTPTLNYIGYIDYENQIPKPSSNSPRLFNWDFVKALPEGCHFDIDTGELKLTPNANGTTILIVGTSIEKDLHGELVATNVYKLEVADVPEYNSGQPEIKLSVSPYLNRGGYMYPTVSFKNTDTSHYNFEWSIEPCNEDGYSTWTKDYEGNKPSNPTSFNMVTLSKSPIKNFTQNNYGEIKHSIKVGPTGRSIALTCNKSLDWNGTYKLKVSVKAISTDGKQVLEAAPKYVTILPVKFNIIPVLCDYVTPAVPFSNVLHAKKQNGGEWRAFYCEFENLYITGDGELSVRSRNLDITGNSKYFDEEQKEIEKKDYMANETYSEFNQKFVICAYPENWINNSSYSAPYSLDYSLKLVDKDYPEVNKVISNKQKFTVNYDELLPKNE